MVAEDKNEVLVMGVGHQSEDIISTISELNPKKVILVTDDSKEATSVIKEVKKKFNDILIKKVSDFRDLSSILHVLKGILREFPSLIFDVSTGKREFLVSVILLSSIYDLTVYLRAKEFKNGKYIQQKLVKIPLIKQELTEEDLKLLKFVDKHNVVTVQDIMKQGLLGTHYVSYKERFDKYMKFSKKIIRHLRKLEDRGFLELSKDKNISAKPTFLGKLFA